MQNPNNANRPTPRVTWSDNESLRAALAAYKVRCILAKHKEAK